MVVGGRIEKRPPFFTALLLLSISDCVFLWGVCCRRSSLSLSALFFFSLLCVLRAHLSACCTPCVPLPLLLHCLVFFFVARAYLSIEGGSRCGVLLFSLCLLLYVGWSSLSPHSSRVSFSNAPRRPRLLLVAAPAPRLFLILLLKLYTPPPCTAAALGLRCGTSHHLLVSVAHFRTSEREN